MGILSLFGSFVDLVSGAGDRAQQDLDRQAAQARLELAQRSQRERANANMQAEAVWSQGVSGSITDQAQNTINTTENNIQQETKLLDQQIAAKQDELRLAGVQKALGFVVDLASTAASIYTGGMDIAASMNLTKPNPIHYQKGEAGSALYLSDYAKWEKKGNIQYFRNLFAK